jgi:hypothetical protein
MRGHRHLYAFLGVIETLEDTLFVFPMGGRLAHFTVVGLAPFHSKHTYYAPTVQRHFYRWGLDCLMVETSDFANSLLSPTDKMATTITDTINYHIDTARGRNNLHALYPSLTATGIDVSQHQTKSALTINGPDGIGAIAMGDADITLTGPCKVVLSLTSPLPLLYATTLEKELSALCRTRSNLGSFVYIASQNQRWKRAMPYPYYLFTYLPYPTLPLSSMSHTPMPPLSRTDLATTLGADCTWASSSLPVQKKDLPDTIISWKGIRSSLLP